MNEFIHLKNVLCRSSGAEVGMESLFRKISSDALLLSFHPRDCKGPPLKIQIKKAKTASVILHQDYCLTSCCYARLRKQRQSRTQPPAPDLP